jgi:hypothetical protein
MQITVKIDMVMCAELCGGRHTDTATLLKVPPAATLVREQALNLLTFYDVFDT